MWVKRGLHLPSFLCLLNFLSLASRAFLDMLLMRSHEVSIRTSIRPSICAENWCCCSSLLGYWAQSWMGHHSDTGYSNGSIIPASWYSFCQPQKDDRLSQPHLILIQKPSGIWTQDLRIPSPPPQQLSQHQAYMAKEQKDKLSLSGLVRAPT